MRRTVQIALLAALAATLTADAGSLSLYVDAGLGWHAAGVERCVDHLEDQRRTGCKEPYGRLGVGLEVEKLEDLLELDLGPFTLPAFVELRHESSVPDGGLSLGDGDRGTEQWWIGIRPRLRLLEF